MFWDSRGWYYFKTDDNAMALSDLSRALEINPDMEAIDEVYCHRAQVYYDMRDYDKAIADLDKSIELDNEYSEAYLFRGLCFKAINKPVEARADFQAAINSSTDQSIIDKANNELSSLD